MVTLATLVFVVPPALLASSMDYNVTGTVRLLRDLSQNGVPPPPDWVAEIDVIGPDLSARWQVLAAGGPDAAERIQAFVVWVRQQLIGAGLSLGDAVVQLVLAMLTAFFFYRNGVAAERSLMAACRRIAGDQAPAAAPGGLRDDQRRGLRGPSGAADLGRALDHGDPGGAVLGLLLFLLALIPFGPVLIWGPAAVWLYLDGEVGRAIFLTIWSIAAGILTDNVLKPYLISRGSNLPLLLILFGVIGGAVTFGVLGLFLGPTLLAVGYALIRERSAATSENPQLDRVFLWGRSRPPGPHREPLETD